MRSNAGDPSSNAGDPSSNASVSIRFFYTFSCCPHFHQYQNVSMIVLCFVVSSSIEKEVVEEYRKRKTNMFETPVGLKQPVFCSIEGMPNEEPKEYPSHIILYTNAKPTLKYCENLKCATLHFINRAQLLESVPDDIAALIKKFWSSFRPKR